MQGKINILLIGATGTVGKRVLSEASRNDFFINCLCRSPESLGINSAMVRAEKGDINNLDDIRNLMKDCSIVISSFGTKTFDQPTQDRTNCVKNLITVMKEQGVKRIITVAGMGIMKMHDNTLLKESSFFPSNLKFVSDDHLSAAKLLEESDLEYTVFAVPQVLQGASKDEQVVGVETLPQDAAWDVNVVNLAQAIVKEAKEGQYIRKIISYTNKKKQEGQK